VAKISPPGTGTWICSNSTDNLHEWCAFGGTPDVDAKIPNASLAVGDIGVARAGEGETLSGYAAAGTPRRSR
jgi:hypothetical protein